MVRRASFSAFLFVILTALFHATAFAAVVPDYKPGDRIEEDVVTPVRLVVVDVEATEKLKEREAQRVPVIYRYYPRALEEADAAFRSTFAVTRSNFLDALAVKFQKQRLEPEEISSTNFSKFVGAFQKQNLLFPVGTDLAARWAGGETDTEIESALSAKLRDALRAFVRSDAAPQDIWVGSTLRVVSPAENEVVTARLVEERGNNISKTNFVSLQRAKTELQNTFPPEDRAVGKYLASFIKPNCLMEADLTRELRAQRTEGILSADRYEAGQVIARRGQTVDRKTLAALSRLKSTLGQPAQPASPAAAVANNSQMRWIIGALAGIFVMLLALFWLVSRRRSPDSLLPARIADGPLELSGDAWQERALRAEQRAQKVQAAARAGLLSHLARWLSQRLTQKLISQRTELVDAHQHAAIEIAELEARLEKVHAPLQERLRAYERRIAELEQELLVKGEENRELIKAKLEIARKQLEIERGKNRLEFN